MKMKRVVILLILCLSLCLCAGAWAAPGDTVLFPKDADGSSSNSAESIVAVGDTLYLLASNGLYAWKSGDAEPRLIPSSITRGYYSGRWADMSAEDQARNSNSVDLLLESGGKLYGLNTVKGALLLLDVTADGVSVSEAAVLDWDDMYIQESDYAYPRQIFSAALMSDRLYLLIQQPSGNWDDYDLLAFDLATGVQAKLAVENVHAIAAYENGQLLCNVYDWENSFTADGKMIPPVMSVLYPATQAVTKLADFPAAQVGGLCYAFDSGTAYVLGRGEVFGYKPGGAFETVTYMPVDYPGDQLSATVLSGGLYAAIPSHGTVYVRNTDPALKAGRVLRIAGGYPDSVSQAFQAAHPEVPVIFMENYFRSAEEITQNIVSGSDSADLFIVSLSYGGFSSLRDKGYVGDLSQSAVLNEAVSKMYPQYVSSIFRDGKLIAFPCRFYCSDLGYSPELLKELGIDKPPQTFFELMDLYVDWVDEYSVAFPNYTLLENIYDIRMELLNSILMNYFAHYAKIGEELKFDTPVFRSLLAKLEEVTPIIKDLNPPDDGSQSRMVIVSGGDSNTPTSLFANISLNPQEYYDRRGYLPLPLSLDEGVEPAYLAQVEVFVMNPNSKNQDLAQTYLEFFAQNMPREISITFCPDDNEPMENPGYAKVIENAKAELEKLKEQIKSASPEDIKSLEEMIKGQEENISWQEADRYIIHGDAIARYRSIVPYISVETQNLDFLSSSQEAVTLLRRFMEGDLDGQQFVREFDRKLQMMRLESN